MNIQIPDGERGNYRVESFTVGDDDAKMHNLRDAFSGSSYRGDILPGTYKRLMRGGTVVMSNTPAEIRTNWPIMHAATGRVLINGLGLGMVVTEILRKPDVKRVTVVEISPDVIDLVGPSFAHDERVEIVCADALEYKPPRGSRFGAVWHDIWDYICADNLDQMKTLHRRYGRRADWQGSWGRRECEDARRDYERQSRWWR